MGVGGWSSPCDQKNALCAEFVHLIASNVLLKLYFVENVGRSARALSSCGVGSQALFLQRKWQMLKRGHSNVLPSKENLIEVDLLFLSCENSNRKAILKWQFSEMERWELPSLNTFWANQRCGSWSSFQLHLWLCPQIQSSVPGPFQSEEMESCTLLQLLPIHAHTRFTLGLYWHHPFTLLETESTLATHRHRQAPCHTPICNWTWTTADFAHFPVYNLASALIQCFYIVSLVKWPCFPFN